MVVTVTWRRALAATAAAAVLGLGVAWSGIVNIGASTGHAAVTDWFLHWAMRNTVRTYAALTVRESAIDDSGLVSSAGHFAATCALCHGAPGEQASPVMRASTPPAPDLAVTAPTWTDAELFWIVKHGVKFTAMPAWPSLERDDEIRRMAAFVRRLPELSPSEYRELAYGASGAITGGQPRSVEAALADCDRCHADHGRGQADIPVLAGQKPAYLETALEEFAVGRRHSGVMSAAAAKIDAPLRAALATSYAERLGGLVERDLAAEAQTVAAGSNAGVALDDTTRVVAGIVAHGLPEADLPACASCHGSGKREQYPRLAGQKPEYLAARLRQWRGDPTVVEARKREATMPVIARRIPEPLIEPLADYLARAPAR
jgi:cytochrome c553